MRSMTRRERSTTWRDDANCTSTDPEVFFPEKGESARPALRVCSRCEVQQDCLDFALDLGLNDGVFGGMSAFDRRELRRGRGEKVPVAAVSEERSCCFCGAAYWARRSTSRYCGTSCRVRAGRVASSSAAAP